MKSSGDKQTGQTRKKLAVKIKEQQKSYTVNKA